MKAKQQFERVVMTKEDDCEVCPEGGVCCLQMEVKADINLAALEKAFYSGLTTVLRWHEFGAEDLVLPLSSLQLIDYLVITEGDLVDKFGVKKDGINMEPLKEKPDNDKASEDTRGPELRDRDNNLHDLRKAAARAQRLLSDYKVGQAT